MTWLPTRSLFWRAFLTFWSAMAIILVCGMMLTAAVAWYRFNSLDGLNPASLTRDAAQIARTQGEEGLARWVQAMDQRYSALKIYIMDAQDADILGRRLPTRMHDWLSSYRAAPGRPPQADYAPAEPAGERVSWWEPQWLALPDDTELLMLFLPFDSSHWEVLALSPVALALLLFALAVTAPFCWALTRHVTAPLAQLRQATHALSAGRLGAHTPAKLARRKDELGLLARDFNAMADRLKALVDTREQLLHNIAHELRSPLARLRLAAELARRKDERQDLQLDRIERECERLDSLVGNTLRLARLGALPVPTDTLDLAEIVSAVVEDARYEAGGRQIRIAWEPHPPVPLVGDRCSLASAIENVLRNALRFAPAHSAIRVRLLVSAREACLEIEDRGPGVAHEELESLFEPFYRTASGARKPGSGAGLGLSIAHAAVAAHKGRMSARNMSPQGLSVRLELPRLPD
ncbi:HAMP domain-containing histidine kinase [Achromobacter denitrificans]|uniref:HAMP domain-containing sensor histidine kinase n=1 Tax=Achromobacter denitrificans TaxID=32002 RepID=UPI000F4FDBAC|nr:HAMP domain-containing sensor histidine kinase [Achromobacter denitrificans]MDX3878021.1 HAMP domain-containing sensor histidine kinase [Achromobacter sp.]MBV2161179.1 HAMP domain-containing histidine kinase [Achromobacter denitrificans]MDF3852090.1 HAMP domain-containing sensor histidine kinase [Achromobacter denitrificans]MDF3860499.1 HAMP domain-containing sensor histidine kinase [Achromobacter denitrificans]QCS65353.1 HAMP domain-containing histidine kinase [Achromobacter denitrificans]